MTHDDLFRLILIGNFVLFLPFALYHRVRSNTGEKLDRWQEGAVILFGLRLGLGRVINSSKTGRVRFHFPASRLPSKSHTQHGHRQSKRVDQRAARHRWDTQGFQKLDCLHPLVEWAPRVGICLKQTW
jgi:hypothetical protein